MKFNKYYFIIAAFILAIACKNNSITITPTSKMSESDPFVETMVKSQYFEINSKEDNVIEGENGTTVVLPKGCFLNSDGEIVEEKIKLELAEALDVKDMILSNLNTTADGKLLETDGMIYINAFDEKGNQLAVNEKNPMYIEIPTKKRLGGMQAYKGVRDDEGNMNWIDPKPIQQYLTPIDMSLLNFYPNGFEELVANGMPFRNYTTVTKEVIDSLFYSFSSYPYSPPKRSSNFTSNLNEPHNNPNKQIVNGKYTQQSYSYDQTDSIATEEVIEEQTEKPDPCGIDPAIIKVIWSDKFNNTLIATREFEARLQTIYKTCRKDVLEAYINNLDKNLYECDSIAFRVLAESPLLDDFNDYYEQKLTTVPEANKYSALLSGYYESKLKEVKSELNQIHKEAEKELKKKDKAADKLVKKYTKVLWKREKYRMEKYGFEWSETGWINVDRGTVEKPWEYKPLKIVVPEGNNYERIYTYVIYEDIKSLYRLNSDDNINFHIGTGSSNQMPMLKNGSSVLITVAYNSDSIFSGKRMIFNSETDSVFIISTYPTSKEELDLMLEGYSSYSKSNRIDVDLQFQAKLYEEKLRQEELKKEDIFLEQLWYQVYTCCDRGQKLFKANCAACHRTDDKKLTAFGLKGVSRKYDCNYIIAYTQNSQRLIQSGDKRAIAAYERCNRVPMTTFEYLDRDDIKAIFDYVDRSNGEVSGWYCVEQ